MRFVDQKSLREECPHITAGRHAWCVRDESDGIEKSCCRGVSKLFYDNSATVEQVRIMVVLEAAMEAFAILGFVFGLIAFVRTERLSKTLKQTGVLEGG